MNASDFKTGDLVSFDFEDPFLEGTEFIAYVAWVEDDFVVVNADCSFEDETIMFVKLDPKILRKVSDTELFKKRLEGKNIGMKGYIKWANGS